MYPASWLVCVAVATADCLASLIARATGRRPNLRSAQQLFKTNCSTRSELYLARALRILQGFGLTAAQLRVPHPPSGTSDACCPTAPVLGAAGGSCPQPCRPDGAVRRGPAPRPRILLADQRRGMYSGGSSAQQPQRRANSKVEATCTTRGTGAAAPSAKPPCYAANVAAKSYYLLGHSEDFASCLLLAQELIPEEAAGLDSAVPGGRVCKVVTWHNPSIPAPYTKTCYCGVTLEYTAPSGAQADIDAAACIHCEPPHPFC